MRVSSIRVQQTVAVLAALFGVATLATGGTVLAGRDPGYLVYRPLLIFNTVMGVAYLAAAAVIWRALIRGLQSALVIAALNAAVLSGVMRLHRTSAEVAEDSVRAMALRVAVWLVFAVVLGSVLAGVVRRQRAEGE